MFQNINLNSSRRIDTLSSSFETHFYSDKSYQNEDPSVSKCGLDEQDIERVVKGISEHLSTISIPVLKNHLGIETGLRGFDTMSVKFVIC